MKKIKFAIKNGVYCSWCADLMKKTLMQNFAMKEVEVDVARGCGSMLFREGLSVDKVLSFLRRRGFYLEIVRI